MSWWDSITNFGKSALGSLAGLGSKYLQAQEKIWKFTSSVSQGMFHVFTHPLSDLESSTAFWAALVTGNHTAAVNALRRLYGFVPQKMVKPPVQQLRKAQTATTAMVMANIHRLWRRISQVAAALRAWVMVLIRHERRARRRADQRVEHLARQLARHALATIQREAASAYRAATPGQESIIERVAGDLIVRDPLLKDLVSRLVSGALDIAEVDDPLLRIGLGFVMKEIINRLGIEKPAGHLLDGLLSSILGDGPPKNLHAVILAICQRLTAMEGQWATFMADGGPEILQAGEEWQKLTSVITDAGLLAFFAAMSADPTGWAGDMADVAGPVVGAAIDSFSAVMTVWR